jgi:hypothetical protein
MNPHTSAATVYGYGQLSNTGFFILAAQTNALARSAGYTLRA